MLFSAILFIRSYLLLFVHIFPGNLLQSVRKFLFVIRETRIITGFLNFFFSLLFLFLFVRKFGRDNTFLYRSCSLQATFLYRTSFEIPPWSPPNIRLSCSSLFCTEVRAISYRNNSFSYRTFSVLYSSSSPWSTPICTEVRVTQHRTYPLFVHKLLRICTG